MSYTIIEETFTFADITIKYLEGDVTEIPASPPVFKTELGLPNSIPCLTSNDAKAWKFELPAAEDPNSDEIFIDF